jgi:hypothetical protein
MLTQIYTVILIGLYIGVLVFKDRTYRDAMATLIHLCILGPLIGRVFGWW